MNQPILLHVGAGADGVQAAQLAQRLDPAFLEATAATPADASRLADAVPGLRPAVGTALPILAPRTAQDAQAAAVPGERAWERIARAANEAGGALEIVSLGALTNLAIALVRRPELCGAIRRVVLLGGSAESGDVTPFAERSIHADPCAAEILFKSGIPVLLFGLNCLRGLDTAAVYAAAGCAQDTPQTAAELLPVAALADSGFYSAAHCFVGVETRSAKTRGMTVCDLYGRNGREPNADVVLSLDQPALLALLKRINGGDRA